MTNETPGEAWSRWLLARLEEKGWRQADLVRNSGGLIKRDRASKWTSGKENPTYRLAMVTANTLDVPQSDALLAAGYITEETQFAIHETEERLALVKKQLAASHQELDDTEAEWAAQLEDAHLSDVPDSVILRVLLGRSAKRERIDADAPRQHVSGTPQNVTRLTLEDQIDDDDSDIPDGIAASRGPKRKDTPAADE